MPIAHPDSGGGGGGSKATRWDKENAIFSFQEIVWCFWATSIFLGGKSHDHCLPASPIQTLLHNFAGNLVIYSIFFHDIFDKMQQFQTAIDSLRKVSVSHVYFLPNTIEYVLSALEDNRYSKMELSLFSLFLAPTTLCNWSVFVRQNQGTTEA